MYRQVTLAGLQTMLAGQSGPPIGAALSTGIGERAYADVLDAFRQYMASYNLGRPFVLIGHSQGSMHLIKLIAEEVEGTPLQDQMLSAILLGANVQVPPNQNLGGSFKQIPLCRSETQTGCIITYSSYRDTNPPGDAPLFGQGVDGMIAGCTNPADLRDGAGEPESYFQTGTHGWTGDPMRPIGTPFVRTPDLLFTTCVSGPKGTYLQVHVNADPRTPRVDDIPGDLMIGGRADPNWGLHLQDVNLSQGDLVRIVERQSRAWRPARR